MINFDNIVLQGNNYTPEEYKMYFTAYKTFAVIRESIFKKSVSLKVDSQISEGLVCDIYNFQLHHDDDFDAIFDDKNIEIKATGYNNDKVRFSNKVADRVFWLKVTKDKLIINEISNNVYNMLDSRGFVSLAEIQVIGSPTEIDIKLL